MRERRDFIKGWGGGGGHLKRVGGSRIKKTPYILGRNGIRKEVVDD
jgi:hypothetical protein